MGESMIEELYAAHFRELQIFLKHHTSDPVLAEDVAQEAFLRSLEHEDTLEGFPKASGGHGSFGRHGMH